MNIEDNESICSVGSIEFEESVECFFDTLVSNDLDKKNVYCEIKDICKQLCNKPKDEPTDNEYFKCFVVYAKEKSINENTKEALMTLLGYSLTKATVGKIRANSGDVSKLLMSYINDETNKDKLAFKHVLIGIGKWLESLKHSEWKIEYNVHCLNRLLSFTVDPKETINNAASFAISSLFQSKKDGQLLTKSNSLVKETIAFIRRIFINASSVPININFNKFKTANYTNDEFKIKLIIELVHEILKADILDVDVVNELVEILMNSFKPTQSISVHCLCLDTFVDLYRYSILSPETSARTLKFLYTYLQSICTKAASGVHFSPHSINLYNAWLNAFIAGIEFLLELHISGQTTFTDNQNNVTYQSLSIALDNIKILITFCSDWLLSDNKVVRQVSSEALLKLVSGKFITIEKTSGYDYLSCYENADEVLVEWFLLMKRHIELPNLDYVTMVLNVMQCIVTRSGIITGSTAKIREETLKICPYFASMRDRYDQSETRMIAELINVDQSKKVVNSSIKSVKMAIESYIGGCIKVYGIRTLLKVLPLNDLFDMDTKKEELSSRTWLVPLMQRYIENCSPLDFQEVIMPFINKLTANLDFLSNNNTSEINSAKLALTVFREQLWKTLPSFCISVKQGDLLNVQKNPLLPSQFPYPIENQDELKIVESGGMDLYKLLVSMLDVKAPSQLESIILKAFKNIMKSAEDKNEMVQLLTNAPFYPTIVLHCFNWYVNPDCYFKLEIQMFLHKYVQLFDEQTFVKNVKFILDKNLADVDLTNPTEATLSNIELLSILGPHMPVDVIGQIIEHMDRFLNDEISQSVSHKIQKKCYRFFEVITASDTDNSCEYTKQNISGLFSKLSNYKLVKSDSKKCRIKTLYNLFKLLNSSKDVRGFLNTFIQELIMSLTEKNHKTRSVSGYLFVESIVNSFDLSDCEDDELSVCLDKMFQHVIAELESNLNDNSAQEYKSALSNALILLLCEQRLSRVVTRWHIEQVCKIVSDIFKNHSSEESNRHLVYCALNIMKGLLKKKTGNLDKISVKDICDCISSASEDLRKKIRMPIKHIIKYMLGLWTYEEVKFGLPDSLHNVVRNVHKALNRTKRARENADDDDNSEDDVNSCATSWIMSSEAGKSTMTMKKPEIRSIAELLDDSESEEEEEVVSKMSGLTMKSSKKSFTAGSAKSKISKSRGNKRKFTEDDVLPILEDGKEDVIDLQDPLSVSRVRYQDTVKAEKDAIKALHKQREIKKKGYEIKDGKLVIGQDLISKTTETATVDSNDECDENTRFAGPNAKRQRMEKKKETKVLGKNYVGKKGVLGDITKKGKMQPHALLFPADINSGVYKKHQNTIKKAMKHTRNTSKKNNMNRSRK